MLVKLTVHSAQSPFAGFCLYACPQESVAVEGEFRKGEVAVSQVHRQPLVGRADAKLVEGVAETRLVVTVPCKGERHADTI